MRIDVGKLQCIDAFRVAGALLCDGACGLEDVPFAAVAEEEYEGKLVVRCRARHHVVDGCIEGVGETGAVAEHDEADAVLHEGLELLDHRLEHQLHQGVDLVAGATPVLLGECEEREILDPGLNRGLGAGAHAFDAFEMPEDAFAAPFPGPSAVTVHNDGHVGRNSLFRFHSKDF